MEGVPGPSGRGGTLIFSYIRGSCHFWGVQFFYGQDREWGIFFGLLKFQIFFGVLEIPGIFGGELDAGSEPKYEEKMRVPPPPPGSLGLLF